MTALICAAAVALAAAAPAALYTAVGGTIRNYTVVVADDGTSAAQDYDVAIGRYQLLTQLNANPGNEPLRKAAVTLSRSDLISFQ